MRTELKVLRIRNFLTQDDMADKLGINRVTYSNIERGVTSGNADFWQKLQHAFNLPDEMMWKLQKKGVSQCETKEK